MTNLLSVIEGRSKRTFKGLLDNESLMSVTTPRPFTVLVEGNIGSGKSTYMKHCYDHGTGVDIIMEPVDKWTDLNATGLNLLQMMYEDPKRWSLVFQTYVQLTMLETHTKASTRPVKMMERSLYSAQYCFVENLREAGKIEDSEYQILSNWFDFIMSCQEIDISVDLIVYLQTRPEVALERVRSRSRGEEHLISDGYIRQLHVLHEDWLVRHKFPVPAPVFVVDANKDVKDMELVFEKMSELFQVGKEIYEEKNLLRQLETIVEENEINVRTTSSDEEISEVENIVSKPDLLPEMEDNKAPSRTEERTVSALPTLVKTLVTSASTSNTLATTSASSPTVTSASSTTATPTSSASEGPSPGDKLEQGNCVPRAQITFGPEPDVERTVVSLDSDGPDDVESSVTDDEETDMELRDLFDENRGRMTQCRLMSETEGTRQLRVQGEEEPPKEVEEEE